MVTVQGDSIEKPGFVRLRPMDVGRVLGYSRKHFYDEAAKHGWEKEEVGPAVFYLVPDDYIAERHRMQETLRQQVTRAKVTSIPLSPRQEEVASDVTLKQLEDTLRDVTSRLEEVTRENKKLRDDMSIFSREIEARNTALVKYKAQEDAIDELRQELRRFREEQAGRPWYRRILGL